MRAALLSGSMTEPIACRACGAEDLADLGPCRPFAAAALEPMPAGIAPEVAASFRANYLTSLYALSERAALRAGEYLLVLGAAGGVGIAAVQLGKLLGARVIAAASTEAKRNLQPASAPTRRLTIRRPIGATGSRN